MSILIVDNNTKHIDELRLLAESCAQKTDIVRWEHFDPKEVQQHDIVILSGGSGAAMPFHQADVQKQIEFIKQTNQPVLGICLGFEIIAHAFGGELVQHKEKELGLAEINIIKPDMVFPSKQSFTAFVAHKYCLDSVPPELVALANSQSGIAVLRHNQKPLYGFQFHPEVQQPANDGAAVFKNFIAQASTVANS